VSSSAARTKAERRELLIGLAGAFVLSACGGEVPAPSSAARSKRTKGHERLDPIELFPADLDLVVRIDLGRIRAQLGPLFDVVAARVEEEGEKAEALAALALKRANIAWIGLRVADLDAGDRLLVVQGDVEDLRPDPAIYRLVDPPLRDDVKTFDRDGPLPRGATARIHQLGAQTIAFVTPIEVDSVARVLHVGPDVGRRDPPAEGLVSADLRARRLPASLERRFPSIASIIRGVEGARAVVTMAEETLRLDITVRAVSEEPSQKTEKLLRALFEGGQASRYALLFEDVTIERLERAVDVRWSLKPLVLRALLDGTIKTSEPVEPTR